MEVKETSSKPKEIDKEDSKKSDLSFNKNMATFTFVDILIAQKHFSDALKVLDILGEKGRSADRIAMKRSEIEGKMGK